MVSARHAVSLSGVFRVAQIASSVCWSFRSVTMCVRIRWSGVGVLPCALLVVFAAACASRAPAAARYDDLDRATLVHGRACDRSDQDTTRYLHLPLYRSCAVTLTARRIPSDVRPDFFPASRDRSCFSAVIEFAVDTLGRPEVRTARLLRANDASFGLAAMAIVSGLRFEPARLGNRPVRQLYELREVFLLRRGDGLERSGRSREASSGIRGMRLGSTAGSGAPSGSELPAPTALGGVC
jgi:hypothetical protein